MDEKYNLQFHMQHWGENTAPSVWLFQHETARGCCSLGRVFGVPGVGWPWCLVALVFDGSGVWWPRCWVSLVLGGSQQGWLALSPLARVSEGQQLPLSSNRVSSLSLGSPLPPAHSLLAAPAAVSTCRVPCACWSCWDGSATSCPCCSFPWHSPRPWCSRVPPGLPRVLLRLCPQPEHSVCPCHEVQALPEPLCSPPAAPFPWQNPRSPVPAGSEPSSLPSVPSWDRTAQGGTGGTGMSTVQDPALLGSQPLESLPTSLLVTVTVPTVCLST